MRINLTASNPALSKHPRLLTIQVRRRGFPVLHTYYGLSALRKNSST
jgi:hypothetical protein